MSTCYLIDTAVTNAIQEIVGEKPTTEDIAHIEYVLRMKIAVIEYERADAIARQIEIIENKKNEKDT